jgi:predicted DNA-binding antitoxin AbrB/MazE fold protein
MTLITLDAVVTNGMLKPTTRLNLPEGAKVQVQLQLESPSAAAPADSLFGAFPELSAITADDLAWAKQLWERSLSDADVERVGHIQASLADEDVALAEIGLDEYARLLDHELVDVPIPSPMVNE